MWILNYPWIEEETNGNKGSPVVTESGSTDVVRGVTSGTKIIILEVYRDGRITILLERQYFYDNTVLWRILVIYREVIVLIQNLRKQPVFTRTDSLIMITS